MSLLGRLEDLSLTDIVQIVFLSRRTGVLEIIDEAGRHTVMFRQGLIANASAPDNPDLVSYLEATGAVSKHYGPSLQWLYGLSRLSFRVAANVQNGTYYGLRH